MLAFGQERALTLPFRLAKDTCPNMIMPFDIISYPMWIVQSENPSNGKKIFYTYAKTQLVLLKHISLNICQDSTFTFPFCRFLLFFIR